MLKKIFIAISLLLVLLFGAILAVPYLFKDKLIGIAKKEMNNYLNAEANFKDVDISIIKDFPNLTFSLLELNVVNKAPFEGDTLAGINELSFSLDILPILKSNTVAINSISIIEPKFNVKVLEDGTANYDIVKETSSNESGGEKASESSSTSDFKITLKQYAIENADILYVDKAGDISLKINNLNHSGNGDFTLEQFKLITTTSIEQIDLAMEGVDYLKNGIFELDLSTFIDLANSTYEIKENRLKLNELELQLQGVVKELPEDALDLNLNFKTPSTNFKSLLSLIPAIYMTDFQGLQADGNFDLKGSLNGVYQGENYPSFNLDLNVDQGTFKYPDLPAAVRQVFVNLNVQSPGGDLNNIIVNLKKMDLKLGEEPIQLKALVKHPMTDPEFDLDLLAKVNLANVKNYYPLEEKLSGKLDLDIKAKGKVSTLEAEKYEEFDANGTLLIKDMNYESADIAVPVKVQDLNLAFNPNKVDLKNLAVKAGKSDLKLAGELENFFAYSLGSGKLKGKLDMASSLLDVDELLGLTGESESEEGSSESDNETSAESSTAFELPDDIDFDMDATFAKITMDNAVLENVKGGLKLSERRLDIESITADVLAGNVAINGFLTTLEGENPFIDFKYDINNLNVKQAYNMFNTVQSLAPIGKYMDGTFSSDMHLKSYLNENLELVEPTVNGDGKVDVRNVSISGFKGIDQITDKLKMSNLKTLKIDKMMTILEIIDGRIHVEPFDVNVRDIKMNVSGSHGIDNSLDYKMLVNVPSQYVSGATEYVGSLIDKANIPGVSSSALPSTLAFNIGMGGTMSDPKLSISLAGKETQSSLKDQAKAEFNKKKEELEQKAREEAERLKREAEQKAREEAEKLKKEAEKKAKEEAERLKREAEQKAREEAEKVKDKAKDEIKGLFGPK